MCGRIILGPWSDHSRTMVGSVPHCKWGFKCFSCMRGRQNSIVICNCRTVGSFPQRKWDCKWCWWMSCRWSFEGSLARNAFLALVIFLLKILLKSASKSSFFFALASRSGFGATISDAVARSSIVLCNSVSADRIVMAASRLLHAVAACVILLSFAAGLRKSYWSGCMKAATVICQQIFSILALVIFLLIFFKKKCFKIVFFSLWRRDPVLELQFPTPLRVVLLCFATQSPQIALEWLRQGVLKEVSHEMRFWR